jgi:NAD(P)-dependent dehydrogenase (short-subunit alcohol dehydrogenase family)
MARQVRIEAVDSFTGKLAVVTGGGSGMGRELVRQLAAQGCSVAACDLNADAVAVTAATASAAAPPGVAVTGHACDVSDEAQVLRFRDELLEEHASDHVDLVFSNAGMGGGESFVSSPRKVWERTFAVDWWGVSYCARVPAAAHRERRRRPGQHQQRERVLGVTGPGRAELRLQHGQVRRAGLHGGAHRGPAGPRAPGPGRARDARARGH